MRRTRFLSKTGPFLLAILVAVLIVLVSAKTSWATAGFNSRPSTGAAAPVAAGGGSEQSQLPVDTRQEARAARESVMDAWENAKTSGAYSFSVDIIQRTMPRASVTNVGRQGKVDAWHMEGETDLADERLLLTMWTQGGSVSDPDTGQQIRVEGEKAYARAGGQSWEEINDFTGMFAPEGDFLNYLTAAKDVVDLGPEQRAGVSYRRYGFEVDGPTYAIYLRDQMEKQMMANGELLPQMHLEIPAQYAKMTGTGELWLTSEGLPLRQVLSLTFPAANADDEAITAEVTVDFSGFASTGQMAVVSDGAAAGAATGAQAIVTPAPLASLVPAGDVVVTKILQMLVPLFMILLVVSLLFNSRNRKVSAALGLFMVLSMVGTPLLQGAQAAQASGRRDARVEQREAREAESEASQAIETLISERAARPAISAQEALAAINNDDGADSDRDGVTDVAERLLGASPLTAGSLALQTVDGPPQLPPNDASDEDGDGLTDYVEVLLGTLPDYADTDGDLITDTMEIDGFLYTDPNTSVTTRLYTDPLEIDTNKDGLDDATEWLRDMNSDGRPDDTDADGVPDILDDDNDGDLVPDRIDISPYMAHDTVFSDSNPFELIVSNLTADELTYVEFQLRPDNPDHLWYAFNVLDWPLDAQGNIQDGDEATFFSTNNSLDPTPNDNGDLRLIPTLELRVPGATDNLPDAGVLQDYGIFTRTLETGQKSVFVPLQLTVDDQGDQHVAFYGKMPYLPDNSWGEAHQVRLAWLVQALVDVCEAYDGNRCSSYSQDNQTQVIYTYPDDWKLTGLNVSENQGIDMAIVYEDPAIDDDLDDDTPLWQLSYGLNSTFLGARVDPASAPAERDITPGTIYDRFNHVDNTAFDLTARWQISDSLRVVTRSFAHQDEAMITMAVTTTKEILNNEFTSNWSMNDPISPTLLFAREERTRSLNLDQQAGPDAHLLTWNGNNDKLTINMEPSDVKVQTMAMLNWAPYRYDGISWESYALVDYWGELSRRLEPEFLSEYPNDPEEVALGAMVIAQLYYLSFVKGAVSVVQEGDRVLERNYYDLRDAAPGVTFANRAKVGAVIVAGEVAEKLTKDALPQLASLLKRQGSFHRTHATTGVGSVLKFAGAKSLDAFKRWRAAGRYGRMGAAGLGIAVVATALVIGAIYLTQTYLSGSEEGRIAAAVVVGTAMTAFTVVVPALQLYELVKVTAGLTKVSSFTALGKIGFSFNQINKASKIAGGVGLVVGIAITWGIFAYGVSNSNLAAGSVAFNTLLAQAIGATILLIVQFVLSLTLVGAIIVAIFAVVDIILTLLGEKTITAYVTEALGKAIYHFEILVDTDIKLGGASFDILQPEKGLVDGSQIRITLPVTSFVEFVPPDDDRVDFYLPFYFTKDNLKSTTFEHELNIDESTLDASKNARRGDWDVGGRSPYYYAELSDTPQIVATLRQGLNTDYGFHLTSGFALPAVDCWSTFIGPAVCEKRVVKDSTDEYISGALTLDVLPATLDEFYDTANWMYSGPQRDHDGDGLIARWAGGNDPEDGLNCNGQICWDLDQDGLSDAYELRLRAAGVDFGGGNLSVLDDDSDNDGLPDKLEIQVGTDPGARDTDRDGLWDSEEVYHQKVYAYDPAPDPIGAWVGGWTFTATYTSTAGANLTRTSLVVSDPFNADKDGDGMSDLTERSLHQDDPAAFPFHPNVFNPTPIAIYLDIDDPDSVVGPGQTFAYTLTVQSNIAGTLQALGAVTGTLPNGVSASAGQVLTKAFNLAPTQISQITTDITVDSQPAPGPITMTANYLARLHNGQTTPTWLWTPGRMMAVRDLPTMYPLVTNGQSGQPQWVDIAASDGTQGGDFSILAMHGATENSSLFVGQPLAFQAQETNITSASDVSPYPFGSGNINRFSDPPQNSSDYAHNSAASIACTDGGECLAAYSVAPTSVCSQVEFDKLTFLSANDSNNEDEYMLFISKPDHGHASVGGRIWEWNWSSGSGASAGDPTELIRCPQCSWNPSGPIVEQICDGDTVDLWEDDDGNPFVGNDDDHLYSFEPLQSLNSSQGWQELTAYSGSTALARLRLRVLSDVSSNPPAHVGTLLPSNEWLETGETCGYVTMTQLNVITSSDGGDTGAASEYYIKLNGATRNTGVVKWQATGSMRSGDSQNINVNLGRLCLNDELTLWEDDPSDDDYIDTLSPLQFVTASSNSSSGVNAFYDGNTNVQLRFTVTPTPRYAVAATMLAADGAPISGKGGLPVRGPQYHYASRNYYPMEDVAVASNGTAFRIAWINDEGYLESRPATTSAIQNHNSGAAWSREWMGGCDPSTQKDLELAWTAQGYVAAWIDACYGENFLYVGRVGALSTTKIRSTGNALRPSMAYNPVSDELLIVWENSFNQIRGALFQGGALIKNNVLLHSGSASPLNPQVAYDQRNNVWMVAWKSPGGISYQPFDKKLSSLLPPESYALPARINGSTFDLECHTPNVLDSDSSCAIVTHSQSGSVAGQLRMDTIFLYADPPWLGTLFDDTTRQIMIDNDDPTVTITTVSENEVLAADHGIVIGGDAVDGIGEWNSDIERVEVRVGYQQTTTVAGAGSWAYTFVPTNGDGQYAITAQAFDRAGNSSAPVTVNFFVDSTPPSLTSQTTGNPLLAASQDGDSQWRISFAGSASDARSEIKSVEVQVTPNGNGWQTATLATAGLATNWTADYALAIFDADDSGLLVDPTGHYTVTLRATDALGNMTDVANYVAQPFRVDETPPVADLLVTNAMSITIGQPLVLTGVVTDPGDVASGVSALDIDFVPSGTLTETWQVVTNVTPTGSPTATWSFQVPDQLEGNYQINVRGTDIANNRQDSIGYWWTGWQGEIDTQAPRIELTATPRGNGQHAKKTFIELFISDRNLDATSVVTNLGNDCGIDLSDAVYLDDPFLATIDPDGQHLSGLEIKCQLRNHLAGPIVVRAADLFGRETVITTTLSPSGTIAPASSAVAALDQVSSPATIDSTILAATSSDAFSGTLPNLVSTVITPSHESTVQVLTPLTVTVTGGAYASDYLHALTLYANGLEVFSTVWPTGTVTDTLWSASWAPPAEGLYELLSVVEDDLGQFQTDLMPISVTVDTQPPAVTLDQTIITDSNRLSAGRFLLSGTATDTVGVEQVRVAGGLEGESAAILTGNTWRYRWLLPNDPDGQSYPVTVTAIDSAHEVSLTQQIYVDVVPPSEVTITLGYVDSSNAVQALSAGDTVRDPASTGLSLAWSAASDGSGVAGYQVDWSDTLSPTLPAPTFYPDATTDHRETILEASVRFAHLSTADTYGNVQIQTEGPIYVDAPTTPDYINPDDDSGQVYRGWMNSGCTLIGTDYEAARLLGGSIFDPQRFYLTWNNSHLRLAWSGADWDVDGDLFIYLDTGSGGSTTAFDPYNNGPAISLPNENSNQMGADYLIWIEDGSTAFLLSWNGSEWIEDQPLGWPNFNLDKSAQPIVTDLYIPLSLLGSATSMNLLALASEEESLNIWAAMPEKNPLNSARSVSSIALPYLNESFALTQQYAFGSVGSSGVCPASGQFEDADLQFDLVAEPAGVTVGFLRHDLPGLTPPGGRLDSNLDGDIDADLPVDVNLAPIGLGQSGAFTVAYTLNYANDGPADATGVIVTVNDAGGVVVNGGAPLVLSLGTVAAGSSASAQFNATVDPSIDGESGEITAVVSDQAHGDFEWFWVQHDIDSLGPVSATVSSPVTYINPFTNTIGGTIEDASPVPTIELEVQGAGVQPACTDPTPGDGQWFCSWYAGGASSGSFQLRARGTDIWGNTGSFGPWHTLIIDASAPTVSLDAASLANLNDGIILASELALRGQVTDDNQAAQAEVCALKQGDIEPLCSRVDTTPAGQATGQWFLPEMPVDTDADGESYTITIYGIDSAGNRSSAPIVHSNVVVDIAAPAVTIDTSAQVVGRNSAVTVLAGTVTDGSGLASMEVQLTSPEPDLAYSTVSLTPSGGAWSYTDTFDEPGIYIVGLEVVDNRGNSDLLGTFEFEVLSVSNTAPTNVTTGGPYTFYEGVTIVQLQANAFDPDGDTLTYSWDLDGDGQYDDFNGRVADLDVTGRDGPWSQQVAVRVTDGVHAPVTSAPSNVDVINVPPQPDAGGPYDVGEGSTIQLVGSAVDAGGDPISYTWDLDDDGQFDDGNTPAVTFDASQIDGLEIRTVTLEVRDDDGGVATASAQLFINNVDPTAVFVGEPFVVNEGATVQLTGSATDPAGLADPLTFEWDLNDDDVFIDASGTTATFDAGLLDGPTTRVASLLVRDDDLGFHEISTTVTINNVPPALVGLAATAIDENGVSTLTGAIVDPGLADTFTMTVGWGDLSATSTYTYPAGTVVFTETHQYLDDNPSGTAVDDYTVSLTITDDDGGVGTGNATATVSNLNPTLSNLAVTDVPENGTATLTGNAADIGTQDSFTLTVSWGDLSATSTYTYPAGTIIFTETHQYLDDNPSGTPVDDYTVDLTLTDDDTGSDTATTTVTVSNLNPTLSNVAITDVFEDGVATLTGNLADVGTQDSFTMTVDWGDGDLSATSTYTYPAGTTIFTETHLYLDDNPSGTASDPYTVTLTLTDDDTGTDVDSVTVTVTNVEPTLSNVAITDVFEDGVATLTGNMADVGTLDSFTMTVSWGDGSAVSTYTYPAGTTIFTETHRYLDDNPSGTASDPYTVSLTLVDDDTGSATESTVVTVTNVNPVLSADVSSQELQYSDLMANVTITGTDVAGDPLQASTSWNINGGGFVSGLPAGMSLAPNSCSVGDNLRTCSWTLSGIADVIAGTYLVRITVDDDDLGQSSVWRTITVTPEDSVVSFDGDNPVAVQVTEPESNASQPFEMVVYIEELEPDQAAHGAAPGEISLAEVSMTLQPVGPGGAVTVACTPVLIDAADNYDDVLQATCSFENVPVNTYSTNVLVDGGYYAGYGEDVLVIYDPSLGFTTGGGWFYWPGTDDPLTGYPGDKTNFGYSMNYNQKNLRNVKGSLLLIRHLADGSKYRVKSNALEGLSLGDAGLFGWASFSGKATYLEPGMLEPIGNHTFLAYVEDHDEPGNGIDGFWLETRDKEGGVILDLSMDRPGSANAEQIQGGNIVVPHSGVDSGNLSPVADFSYSTNDLDVEFTNWSDDPDGGSISWSWDFGDGSDSMAENPSHTYAAGGTYNVTLTVTDDEGASDAASQQVTVSGGNQSPVAGFSYTIDGLSVTFTDASEDPDGTMASWSWDFGDGTGSNSQNPEHTFPSSGTYDVLLTVTDNGGASDTLGQQVTVSDGGGVSQMYIGGMTGVSDPDGGGNWNAMVTIQVLDDSGDPLVNATVNGSWNKGFYASSSCTTDANGECMVEQTGIGNKTRWVAFTIDGVTHSAHTYDSVLNTVSSIRVDRP